MSFLAPFFLLGALAVGLPVLFHLIRRTTRDKVPFSSLMFLKPSPPRVTRRSRLENLLLLLLRCLVLCVLALGFARPFFERLMPADPDVSQGKKILVLLDVSASMQREGLWPEALARAESVLSQAKPADQVAVFAFGRRFEPVIHFDAWTGTPVSERVGMAAGRLKSLTPGWSATLLGPALLSAVEALQELATEETEPGPKRIVVISDLQEGSRLDGLQGYEWPGGVEVSLETVKAVRPTNAGLHLLPEREDQLRSADESELLARIPNSPDSQREQFQLQWQQGSGDNPTTVTEASVDVYVPPNQARIVQAPKTPSGTGPFRLLLTGDDEPFDNTAWHIPPSAERISVLYLGNDEPGNPNQMLYYLRRAFPETRRHAIQILARTPGDLLPPPEEEGSALVIVSGAQDANRLQFVRGKLEQGKTALLVMRGAEDAATLANLAGVTSVDVAEAEVKRYAMLGQMDFSHPLFAPFADPRYSDFTKIHFWKHRAVKTNAMAGARVAARFDDGNPALLHLPVGRGSLLVLTSGWHPADSQLALSSKFVPLLHSLLELSGAIQSRIAQLVVGDEIPLSVTNGAVEARVRSPDGTQVAVPPGGHFSGTDRPGFYTVTQGDKTTEFAVNLAPEESQTSPMPVEELESYGVPMRSMSEAATPVAEEARRQLRSTELENRQKLWRWLIVAALIFLMMESWLAGRLSRTA